MLYAADAPAGAIGEGFGNHSIWTEHLLAGPPSLPMSRRALAFYEIRGQILDLDDAAALLDRALKPSHVVIQDRTMTQNWAMRIFEEGRWAGVRWWSRHDARWGACGLWDIEALTLVDVEPLARDHPAVVEAMELLGRPWIEIG